MGLGPVRRGIKRGVIYDQSLIIGRPASDLTAESLPLYKAVVVFNLGLTFHISAANTPPLDKVSLLLAANLYTQAIRYLTQGQRYCRNPALLFAVLLNNLAEVYFQLGECEACRFYLCKLRAAISPSLQMEECELDGLLYNLMNLPFPPLHASAP